MSFVMQFHSHNRTAEQNRIFEVARSAFAQKVADGRTTPSAQDTIQVYLKHMGVANAYETAAHIARLPLGWQVDAANLETSLVQMWANGCLQARVPLAEAQLSVLEGRAFVITAQAIGALNALGEKNS